MTVDVRVPAEFQGAVVGDVHRRKGTVAGAEADGARRRRAQGFGPAFGNVWLLHGAEVDDAGERGVYHGVLAPRAGAQDAAKELIAAKGGKK